VTGYACRYDFAPITDRYVSFDGTTEVLHQQVGVVVRKDGDILATGYRGETEEGRTSIWASDRQRMKAGSSQSAWGRTLQDIAVKWHQIDNKKVIVEGLQHQGSGSSHGL
jgi:deoxycytidylate deaminase